MAELAHITTWVVYQIINILQYAMLARALLSWIMPDAEGGIFNVIYTVTEPLIGLVRKLLYRLNIDAEGPLDFSFLITVLLLFAVQSFLSALL